MVKRAKVIFLFLLGFVATGVLYQIQSGRPMQQREHVREHRYVASDKCARVPKYFNFPVPYFRDQSDLHELVEPTRVRCVNLTAVFYIGTKCDAFARRSLFRDTFANSTLFSDFAFVYVVGLSSSPAINAQILTEGRTHGDMLQGNFLDTYRNLTFKNIYARHWIVRACAAVRYVIKLDDDVLVDMHQLRRYLAGLRADLTNSLFCTWIPGPRPVYRDGGWRFTRAEYNLKYIPSYCKGLAYIATFDLAQQMSEIAFCKVFTWIEDINTGLLAHVFNATFYYYNYYHELVFPFTINDFGPYFFLIKNENHEKMHRYFHAFWNFTKWPHEQRLNYYLGVQSIQEYDTE